MSNEDRELGDEPGNADAGMTNSTDYAVRDLQAVIGPGSYYIGACVGDVCLAGESLVVPGISFVDFVVNSSFVQPQDSLNITAEVRCYGEAACDNTTVYFFRMLGEVSERLGTEVESLAGNTARNFTFGGEVVNYMEDFALYDGCTDLARGVCTDQVNVSLDSDSDGIANTDDTDDDGDGLLDTADTGDSASMIPCRLLPDCDSDGLNDDEDTGVNSMNMFCRLLPDCDSDGLNDIDDTGRNSANMFCRLLADCDGDGLNDDEDTGVNSANMPCRLLTDCDGDGINDIDDTGENGLGIRCHELADCDGDGINDNEDTGEIAAGMLCRHLIDCDSDGLNDIDDTGENNRTLIACRVLADCDGDTIRDVDETGQNSDGMPCHELDDCDRDGLLDTADTEVNSDGILCRILTDCDGDGLNDIDDTGENNRTLIACRVLADCDGDGLNDIDDTGVNMFDHSCRLFSDCDGDGLNDNVERGVNSFAYSCHELLDCDLDGRDDNVDVDEDGDGLIELRTADELNNIRHVLDGSGYQESAAATKDTTGCPGTGCNGYELGAAADLSSYGSSYDGGKGWQPIGETATPFTAIFDGNGLPIRNLFIERADEDDIGFFGVISGDALIRSVSLEDIMVTGRSDVGGLIGETAAGARILASAVSGDVISSLAAGPANAGGLVGNGGSATIIASYARGTVSGMGSTVGGLVGDGENTTIITSYTTNSTVSGDSMVGGLVGDAGTDGITITSSYAVGTVDMTGTGASSTGGLIGSGGNLVITNSYWDSSVNGITTTGSGEPKTTMELQLPLAATGIYADWMQTCPNDESVFAWDFGNTNHYPALNCPSGGILLQRY